MTQDCCKAKNAEMLAQHRLQVFSEGSPKGMTAATIEMLPGHRVPLRNELPNGLRQLLLHAPTLLVMNNRHFNRQLFTSPSNHSRAVHQAHLLIVIQVVPEVEKTFHTGMRAYPLKKMYLKATKLDGRGALCLSVFVTTSLRAYFQ